MKDHADVSGTDFWCPNWSSRNISPLESWTTTSDSTDIGAIHARTRLKGQAVLLEMRLLMVVLGIFPKFFWRVAEDISERLSFFQQSLCKRVSRCIISILFLDTTKCKHFQPRELYLEFLRESCAPHKCDHYQSTEWLTPVIVRIPRTLSDQEDKRSSELKRCFHYWKDVFSTPDITEDGSLREMTSYHEQK